MTLLWAIVAIIAIAAFLFATRAAIIHRDNAEFLQRRIIELTVGRMPQYVDIVSTGRCIIKGETERGCTVDFIVNNYRMRFRNMPATVATNQGEVRILGAGDDYDVRFGTNDETATAMAMLQRHTVGHTEISLRNVSMRRYEDATP